MGDKTRLKDWRVSAALVLLLHVQIFKELNIQKLKFYISRNLRGCLVCDFKQQFLVFKQHFMHFNALFHPHVFPQIFSNNNFQFLNTRTKRALSFSNSSFTWTSKL